MAANVFDDHLWKPFHEKQYDLVLQRVARHLDTTRAADAIHIGGLALMQQDRVTDGINWLQASVALLKGNPDWFSNAITATANKKRYDAALMFLDQGLALFPDHMRLRYLRAVIYTYVSRHDEALVILDQLIAEHPEYEELYLTRGYALHMLSRFDDALASYAKIKRTTPEQYEELLVNRHGVLMDLRRCQEAYDLISKNFPTTTHPMTIYNNSLTELGLGHWPQAWHHYRTRPHVGLPPFLPRAERLEDLAGKELFLFCEQGFGDCIQFVRYAPLLNPACAQMTIGTPPALMRLFECLKDPRPFRLLTTGSQLRPPQPNQPQIALPLLDAPALLNTTVATIPSEIPYFKLPRLTPKWQRSDPRPHIGVVWAGASRKDDARAFSVDQRRSVPFEIFAKLLDAHCDVVFVNMQLPGQAGAHPRMISVLERGFDMLDTALILDQLDLLITIDSSLCHLAGALGKSVWMLSRFDACWRWFWNGETASPWYPSMTIYRQLAHASWPAVVARVAHDLATTFG